jgi:hypothetical protein
MEFRENYLGIPARIRFDNLTSAYVCDIDTPEALRIVANSYEDLQKLVQEAVEGFLSGRRGALTVRPETHHLSHAGCRRDWRQDRRGHRFLASPQRPARLRTLCARIDRDSARFRYRRMASRRRIV